jgi:hypothetical protein
MSTTYLEVVNELLAETNEVELTSGTFSSAVGIHSYVKKIANRAYMDICAYKKTWPFLSAAESNVNDPFAGNVYIPTVAGQRWYLLKPGSTDTGTDYSKVDWNSFFITTEGVSGETTPYTYEQMKFLPFGKWFMWRSENEASDAGGPQDYGLPDRVIASKDGRYVGLSCIPDKEYRLYFNAWVQPTKLNAHGDVLKVPDKYIPVLLDKARSYLHQFKQDEVAVNVSMNDYRQGLRKMCLDLIGEDVKDISDDRIR